MGAPDWVDVFPMEDGDFPASHVSLLEGTLPDSNSKRPPKLNDWFRWIHFQHLEPFFPAYFQRQTCCCRFREWKKHPRKLTWIPKMMGWKMYASSSSSSSSFRSILPMIICSGPASLCKNLLQAFLSIQEEKKKSIFRTWGMAGQQPQHGNVLRQLKRECWCREVIGATVDGRNPAPVEMVNIPFLQGFIMFYTSQVVVWDFFHQQYGELS